MGKQFRWDRIAAGGALRDDLAQLGGIPEDDAGGEQVHAGDAIMLPFAGAVPDLAATVEADGALQGVVGLTLVESDLGLALHAGVEDPVDHEQASLDATDLAHGDGEFMLAGIGRRLRRIWLGGTMPAAMVAKVREYRASSAR